MSEVIEDETENKNYTKKYLILVYSVFWVSIILVGGVFLLSNQNKTVVNIGSAVASWTPTIILIILMIVFPKLIPNDTRKI